MDYFDLLPLTAILLCSLPYSRAATSSISSNQPLADGQTIISPTGIFELGFFSPLRSTNRYVGIWYRSFRSTSTFVWIANRKSPISDTSGSLAIAGDGNLVLLDGSKHVVWTSGVSTTSRNLTATLLDSGNLVLNDSEAMVWESFDNPTDTYLPGMKIGLDLITNENHVYTSWRSDDDPSPGRFTIGMNPDRSTQIFIWDDGRPRWRSGRWNGQIFIGVEGMVPEYIYGFRLNNFVSENLMYFYYSPINSMPQRFVLSADGMERQFEWQYNASAWEQIWSQPRTQCELYNRCGNNATCTNAENATQPPACECLKGFVKAPEGCVRRTPLQCERNGSAGEGEKDGFYHMGGINLPDLSDWDESSSNAERCEESCLMNCSCKAYSFVTGIGCLKWAREFVDIHIFFNGGNDFYLKLAGSELVDKKAKIPVFLLLVIGIPSLFALGCICLMWMLRRKIRAFFRRQRKQREVSVNPTTEFTGVLVIEGEGSNGKRSESTIFSFDTVAEATSNFSSSNLLGEGGFGPVYKGVLRGGQEIAVKKLSNSSGQGIEQFKNEVILIAKLQHRNLVRLLGFCAQSDHKMLIYEYMPNKSLDAFLFDQNRKRLLDWNTRYNIIEGIARGLLYLHRDSRLRVIHRDLKASNILLDDSMNPRISDFGMAKIFGSDGNETATKRVVGSYGYMSPEYAMKGLFSVKSDVYSFGILVLEIISGERNSTYQHPELYLNLIACAWKHWNEEDVMEFVDPSIRDSCELSDVSRCVQLGLSCVQDRAHERPTMATAIVMLEGGSMVHPMPRQPTFAFERSRSESLLTDQRFITENSIMITMLSEFMGRCSNISTIISLFLSAPICFISLHFFPSSQAASYLTPHQPLTVGNSLVSDGGVFELGFFSPGRPNRTYLGIWYCNSQGERIVWVANRDLPISDSSGSLAIANDGNLVVLDGKKSILWSSNISSASNSNITAEILDSGNLMLNSPSGRLWQSFDYPTDTYLPGMRVGLDLRTNKNQMLISWRSSDDPAPGHFSISHDPNRSTQIFMWNGGKPRWRSGMWNGQVFIGIENMIYAYSYGYKLSNIDEEQKMYYYINSNSSQYWVLTSEGVYTHFRWNGDALSWSQFWAAPVSACEEYNQCGNNGGCRNDKAPICDCLTGFVPRSSSQWKRGIWAGGCVRRTKLGCNRNGSIGERENKPDKFYLMEREKLPDLATIIHIALDLNTCQAKCTRDCSCKAYSFVTGIGCMTWGEEMRDIQIFQNGGNDLYIRLAGSEFGHEDKIVVMLIIAAILSLGSLGCICLLWKYRKRIKEYFKQRSQQEENAALFGLTEIQEEGKDGKRHEIRVFTFHDMVAATDGFCFENLLGEGGFGPVYKGILPGGQQIAVKRLSESSRQGMEEFKNEVKLISKLQHSSLVRLEGFCIHGEEMMLIYEYMDNGSLEDFLFGSSKRERLDWKTRYNIIEGIARGLLYLHRDSRLGVIHRDLKASNILLDEEMNPKISDFGIARIFGKDSNETKTKRVIGTYGYMSPEYAMQGLISIKSDVYSFGVLLLEIVSGRRNSTYQHPELCLHLLPYAWKLWNEDNEMELVDPLIRDSCQPKEVSRCIEVGLQCVQDQATDRPTMSTVVMMLEWRTTTHSMPKEPIFALNKNPKKRKIVNPGQEDDSNDVSITLLTGRT
ncbi:G-type lectin S-receptor-like serine/threonine-protein kinase B120 [Phalaenopsis equestris]|uniref:G-type lectin S-receptor-like serine/threonine-protein kinase B120 n=1 Tax=Phalaenopsis equestris TaxID=78828 RepID=UPI0009E659D7|nr:G-type lectin S-receptor-like serine/threonine-protein kinase B120 [Phalaenopsis equestris]